MTVEIGLLTLAGFYVLFVTDNGAECYHGRVFPNFFSA